MGRGPRFLIEFYHDNYHFSLNINQETADFLSKYEIQYKNQ